MRTTYIYAAIIAVLIALWLLSGQLGDEEAIRHATLADQNSTSSAAEEDRAPTRVSARISQAQGYAATVGVRGRTQNKRSVQVRAETRGRIEARPVEKGDSVTAGDLLCELAIEDRRASVAEAAAALRQAQIDHAGAQRLKKRGLQADTDIARTRARLAATEAAAQRSRLELARTKIRAPFDGLVEDTHAEVGDYVQVGEPCATVIDLDPMMLVGRLSETNVTAMVVGNEAIGTLGTGEELAGEIAFVGRQSDASTRTYQLEIAVPNPDYEIRSGLTAQIRVPVGEVQAHLVSPALFALNTAGDIGIRTLSDDNIVVWNNISIVADGTEGAWITGLPDIARIITVGQETVVPGEEVDPVFEEAPRLPAARQNAPGPTRAPAANDQSPPTSERKTAQSSAA